MLHTYDVNVLRIMGTSDGDSQETCEEEPGARNITQINTSDGSFWCLSSKHPSGFVDVRVFVIFFRKVNEFIILLEDPNRGVVGSPVRTWASLSFSQVVPCPGYETQKLSSAVL